MKRTFTTTANAILMTAVLTLGTGISHLTAPAAASGGPGGGSGSGGGGGGTTASGVVAYSNFGPTVPISLPSGWAVVGLQVTGFFSYLADEFTPTVSGTVSRIRVPIHQYDTGGNGAFLFCILTDNPNAPGTPGTLIGSFQGQSARDTSTTLATISVSNGPRLVAGQQYWAEIVPSSQSREAWNINPMGSIGLQYGIDSNSWYVMELVQGAFEISVLP